QAAGNARLIGDNNHGDALAVEPGNGLCGTRDEAHLARFGEGVSLFDEDAGAVEEDGRVTRHGRTFFPPGRRRWARPGCVPPGCAASGWTAPSNKCRTPIPAARPARR